QLDPDLYWGGEQAAWWGPMAIAVIVGIIFATVLTLLVVPVMYSLVDDASDWVQRTYVGDGREAVPVIATAGELDGEGERGATSVEAEPVGAGGERR
ncbi:MAG: hypothetical protein WD120_01460, partial [Gemmatimonadota bacterium]